MHRFEGRGEGGRRLPVVPVPPVTRHVPLVQQLVRVDVHAVEHLVHGLRLEVLERRGRRRERRVTEVPDVLGLRVRERLVWIPGRARGRRWVAVSQIQSRRKPPPPQDLLNEVYSEPSSKKPVKFVVERGREITRTISGVELRAHEVREEVSGQHEISIRSSRTTSPSAASSRTPRRPRSKQGLKRLHGQAARGCVALSESTEAQGLR